MDTKGANSWPYFEDVLIETRTKRDAWFTSLTDIARELGLPLGSVYYHISHGKLPFTRLVNVTGVDRPKWMALRADVEQFVRDGKVKLLGWQKEEPVAVKNTQSNGVESHAVSSVDPLVQALNANTLAVKESSGDIRRLSAGMESLGKQISDLRDQTFEATAEMEALRNQLRGDK